MTALSVHSTSELTAPPGSVSWTTESRRTTDGALATAFHQRQSMVGEKLPSYSRPVGGGGSNVTLSAGVNALLGWARTPTSDGAT